MTFREIYKYCYFIILYLRYNHATLPVDLGLNYEDYSLGVGDDGTVSLSLEEPIRVWNKDIKVFYVRITSLFFYFFIRQSS